MIRDEHPRGPSRRALIGAGAALGVGAAVAAPAAGHAETSGKDRRPKKLVPGDLVVMASPGGTPTPEAIERGIALLQSWGLRVEVGEHAFDELGGYLAGTDDDRLADLNWALGHPEAKAFLACRGGYGTTRIIDRADFDALEDHPKVVIGYSDITTLHLGIAAQTRLPSLHSPMGAWSTNNTPATAEALRAALMTTAPVALQRDPLQSTANVFVGGKASGKLIGGNLSLLDAEPENRNFPYAEDKIILIEEVEEARYRVDNMLTRLLRAGAFDDAAGIVIGHFTPREDDLVKPGEWTLSEVIMDRLGGLGIPILGGVKIGHDPDPRVVPLGTHAELDADAGTLVVEAVVKN